MTARSHRSPALLALAFLGGLIGESLLFMDAQCGRIEESLREDFKAVLFLKRGVSDDRLKVLEDKIRALGGVDDLRYVSRDEALTELRRADPELVQSVSLLGENPLSSAFEVRFAPESVGRAAQWVAAAYDLGEVASIRYKPAQARAILQVQFYRHFLGLAFHAAVVIVGLLFAHALWSGGPRLIEAPMLRHGAWAAGAAFFGMSAALLLAWPMRGLLAGWAWPSPAGQIALWAAAAGAAALCAPCP